MSGSDEQAAIIACEMYWFGGLRDSDCHSSHVDRSIHGSQAEAKSNEDTGRHIHGFYDEEGHWQVAIDGIKGCLLDQVELNVE